MPGFAEKQIAELQPGDVIAKPVYTEDGSVLLSADTVLMARHISLLDKHGVFSVIVECDEAEPPQPEVFVRDDAVPTVPRPTSMTSPTAAAVSTAPQDSSDDALLATILHEAEARREVIAKELPPSIVS
ncbi:MAG: hypothetical protein ACOCXX_03750 [Planctomycetota bacterium]